MASKPYTYCPYCGKKLEVAVIEGCNRKRCPECETVFYMNPLPVVSALVVNAAKEVLLVLRENEPCRDMWCLPMGFAEVDESIHDAVLRELAEEAGIKGHIVRLLDAQTEYNSFYGNMSVLCYEVEQIGGEIKAGDDAKDARFFPFTDIPELAFSANRKVIDKYHEFYSATERDEK